ncbi:MAG: AMP-binding protein [Verrucomicrobiota bacterium]|nr:AMP-binding protein [Verrucomicrobiota bacterium]
MINQRDAIIDNGEAAFMQRASLRGHLGYRCLRELASRPSHVLVVDLTKDRRDLNCGKLLAVALALSRRWRKSIPGKRVGVVFPAGLGSFVTNLALLLADKVPVNLNFTSGRAALEASLRKAGISTIISTAAVKEKFPDFPWTTHLLDLLTERESVGKASILGWLMAARMLPASLTARLAGVPKLGGEQEATILFSSGSSGDPKGVVLSHRNLIGNCEQIIECGLLNPSETMLGCLPTFHSFGFTVTLLYPMISGMRVVTVPSPLDTKRIAQAIQDEKITVMVGAPTFLRPYLKRATPEQLSSLKLVVAGAEKTPAGFGDLWEQTFGSTYLEGYGLTETSPVACVNLPERASPDRTRTLPPASLRGSVGQLFPGMSARIVDPGSGKGRKHNEVGMLELRGPNIFRGYLDDPHLTDTVFRGNWFITGDLARIDDAGYIHIEGRVSRFSKIGGEMVPHGTVESAINSVYALEDSEQPQVAVTGVTDPQKGEALVLLTTFDIDPQQLRSRLIGAGLPNLWIPRRIQHVDHIPMLASGKLDLRTVAETAKESANGPENEGDGRE